MAPIIVSEACQINDLDHRARPANNFTHVSEACQINDLDHARSNWLRLRLVSEACQINDLDHGWRARGNLVRVSEACQINDPLAAMPISRLGIIFSKDMGLIFASKEIYIS